MIIRAAFFILVSSIFATALSCINLNEELEKKVEGLVLNSYPSIEFNALEINQISKNDTLECDYVKFDMPKKVNLKNDFILKLDVFKNDQFMNRITKVYRFSGNVEVLKTAKVIERGTPVSSKVIEKQITSIHNITNYSISKLPSNKMQFRNYVSNGEIVENWMIEEVPDVKKGQAIKAIVKKENITLTLDGRVLENGIIGNTIKLKLNDKIMIGKLYDEKTVIINRI